MDFVLKVTPERLVQTASEITGRINAVERAFRTIGNTVNSSSSYWEGDASTLHQKKFKELEPEIQRLVLRLKERPDDLLKMAGLYKETEQKNVADAGSLPGTLFT